jgi:hypothetical protein
MRIVILEQNIAFFVVYYDLFTFVLNLLKFLGRDTTHFEYFGGNLIPIDLRHCHL